MFYVVLFRTHLSFAISATWSPLVKGYTSTRHLLLRVMHRLPDCVRRFPVACSHLLSSSVSRTVRPLRPWHQHQRTSDSYTIHSLQGRGHPADYNAALHQCGVGPQEVRGHSLTANCNAAWHSQCTNFLQDLARVLTALQQGTFWKMGTLTAKRARQCGMSAPDAFAVKHQSGLLARFTRYIEPSGCCHRFMAS